MKKTLARCLSIVMLIAALVSLTACDEEIIKSSTVRVSYLNTGDEACYMWLSGETKSADKILLKNGLRVADVKLTYNMTDVAEEAEADMLQREDLKLIVEKADGTLLEYSFDVGYGDGEGSAISITFDGTDFSIEHS